MRGLRMSSESDKEKSRSTPGKEEVGEETASPSDGAAEGDAGGVGAGGFWFGELRCSITDLHSCASIECFLHEPFLMIFSRAGIKTTLSRESTSLEAIPSVTHTQLGTWEGGSSL